MREKEDFDLYVFPINAYINQKSRLSLDVESDTVYSVSFTSCKANAVLSFSHTAQEPGNIKNATGYKIHFTKALLNEETIMLSEKLELFKPELPKMFFISPHQEWRVKEIFENLLNESTKTDLYTNEMMRTLIHVLILLSRRLVSHHSICP